MSVNTPIVNVGLKYVNGLALARTGNKTLTVAAGAARDSTNINDIVLSALVTNTGTTLGANGVDVAVLANSSLYAVYLIGDSTKYQSTASLLSLNATTPSLPSGYDMFRRIGWARTDGSANLLLFYHYGAGQERTYYYDVGISELSGGAATTFTAIDLATSVPPISTEVALDVLFTPDGATEVAEFLPGGSAASAGIVRYGCGVAAAQQGALWVPCVAVASVPTVLYKVATGDTLTVLVTGFRDYLV